MGWVSVANSERETVLVQDLPEPTHGVGGWNLEDFEWFEEDGMALLEYERKDRLGNVRERREVWRSQPTKPSHEGWKSN